MALFFKKHWHFILFFIAILLFVLFEIPYLNRPFYWDEAWSYATAVRVMSESGPSMMPGSIDEYLYRGHPLFFYFISSIWVKLVGSNLAAIHALYLLLSLSLFYTVFYFGTQLVNKTAGLIASLLFMSIPLVVAQATFLLPEIIVALLGLLTLLFYWKKRIVLEIISGSLLVLTKESGIVMIGTILIFDLVSKSIKIRSFKDSWQTFISLLPHAIPLLVAASFFIIQRIKLGWFLYPEHTQLIVHDVNQARKNFIGIIEVVFLDNGRKVLFFISIISAVILVIKKGFTKNELVFIMLSLLFILFYILFSSINFYVSRYSLSILPFIILLYSFLIIKSVKKWTIVSIVCSILFAGYTFSLSLNSKKYHDNDAGFLNMVNVHKQAINFCEDSAWYNDTIHSHFLMAYYLTDPFMGYLKGDKYFKHVNAQIRENTEDIVIISAIEPNPELDKIKSDPRYYLLKRFEKPDAWCEIYKRK